MNVKQENQKSNYLDNLLRVKQLVCLEVEKKKKEAQELITLFKSFKKSDLLEKEPTVLRNKNVYVAPSVDFSYYKLNLEFLKMAKINLEKVSHDIIISDSSNNMMYVEYYIDKKNGCIIFVKFLFNHIRLYSENGKTDCLTYTFINSKTEIYYYDKVLGCKLLKQFSIKTTLSQSKDLIKNKSFNIQPANNRTFKISCGDNSEVFEEKSFSDIHMLIKYLTDILINQYNYDSIPSNLEIHIDTKFLGDSEESVSVQTEVKIDYNHFGVIQLSEKLLEYEITLYFLDFPDKKVTAKFYLTESEITQSLVLTDNLLENIGITHISEKINKKLNYKNLYQRYLVNKMNTKSRNSDLDPIAKTIYNSCSVDSKFVNYSKLHDSFKGIYFEYFKIDVKEVSSHFPFQQIGESKFKCDDDIFSQSAIYYALYNEKVYLVEVYTSYVAYTYEDCWTTVYLPAFGIKDIELNIFTPTNVNDVNKFVNKISEDKPTTNTLHYFNTYFKDISLSRKDDIIGPRKLWKTIFPDFIIETGAKIESYEVISTDSGTIYKKLLACITESRVTNSSFNFSTNYPFGFDSEECEKKRFALTSNGLTYGYYFDDGIHSICVNSPFRDNCDYSYSSGDDLMKIVFDNKIPYYKTTLHTLFEKSAKLLSRNCNITDSSFMSLSKVAFWKECINFLLSKSCEDLFK